MKLEVHHTCDDFNSYRAARVKAMFNAESGCRFDLSAELPIEGRDWRIGAIVGPSGSGKSSLAAALLGTAAFYDASGWPRDKPIIDAIDPGGPLDAVTAALSSVGLGSVPTWLRPYRVLSTGEKFRADLARILCERPTRVVIDEFAGTLDPQIARFGAMAFAKAWRRGPGQCLILTPREDILRWVAPGWWFRTDTATFAGRWLRRRPTFDLTIHQTDWRFWPMFEPHHYLKVPRMVAATCYVGVVDGRPVAHLGVATRPGLVEARACRLVVMPEWQGAGVGMRFLNGVCELWRAGQNRFRRKMPTLFHTSHPGLAAALRRDPRWTQVSASLHGDHKGRGMASLLESARRHGYQRVGGGYGGHFRAVQGFRYLGEGA